ncbi:MAG TPA: hypothetical protein VGO47_14595 [Chlamydiales bacterium]|jgi:hypothetical protein|nr:hypothetical protein [Chlamydiales bacterium]
MNKCILILMFFSFLTPVDVLAKIRLLTFHCNKPQFLELQCATFSKFLEDEYELIVINDAKTPALEKKIKSVCDSHGIQCVRYEPEWHAKAPLTSRILDWLHNPRVYSLHYFYEKTKDCIADQPSVRHSHVIQYALERFGYDHDDIIALVDGDVFPIRSMNIRQLLKDRDIVAVQKRLPNDPEDPLTKAQIDYLWVTFAAFDPRKIPSPRELQFQVDVIDGVIHDTGSASYHYLVSHPNLRVDLHPRYVSNALAKFMVPELLEKGFSSQEIQFIKTLPSRHFVEFYINHCLLHFANSCWDHEGYQEKTWYVNNFIDQLLEEEF